jgi:hypothetical protein
MLARFPSKWHHLNERNQRQGDIRKKKGRRHGALKAGCGLKVNASSPFEDRGPEIDRGLMGRPRREAATPLMPRSHQDAELEHQAQPAEPIVN